MITKIRDLLGNLFPQKAPGVRGVAKGGESRAWAFADMVMAKHHFTEEAQHWLRGNVRLRVDDYSTTSGGGYWQPETREVRLFTAQEEAAVHELAHAWWHDRRHALKDEMIEATIRLSDESNPAFREMARLAYGYIHGIPEQNWPGMLVDRNDWEMFAGLASGSMGDMGKLPPYVSKLYQGLFTMPAES